MDTSVENILTKSAFTVDSNALSDYGVPNYYGTIQTPKEFEAAGIRFNEESRYGDYDLTSLQALGIGKGASISGIDANNFLVTDNPYDDKELYRQTNYTKAGDSWKAGKVFTGRNDPMSLGDAFKIAAPFLLPIIPGLGAGLSSAFGGGFAGSVGSRAVMGGITSAIQGGNIGKGIISGGLSAGLGSVLKPIFGNSTIGRAATSGVSRAVTAKATGGDAFNAGILGVIGGANIGKSLGLEGSTANFVNDLARITAQVNLQQRKKRGG